MELSRLTTQLVVEAVLEVLDRRSGVRDPELALTAATALEELEFGSLDVTELLAILEDRLGRSLDPDSVAELRTIGDVSRLTAEPGHAQVT
jgi:acyl carrier protein